MVAQPAGPHSGVLFVFLNSLECKAGGVAQLLLAHSKHHAPHAHSAADVMSTGLGTLVLAIFYLKLTPAPLVLLRSLRK